ncbi:hypothetical protein PVAP13_3NG079914 [Panicum virgatum]|uniref:Uncharacterized protein n=3 Tax=Panicum TaxID=4539 RepID=A0A8T0U1U3_PANVG|nr:hypothetical protein PVAP13_3NG079914 [Panicum virgatum]
MGRLGLYGLTGPDHTHQLGLAKPTKRVHGDPGPEAGHSVSSPLSSRRRREETEGTLTEPERSQAETMAGKAAAASAAATAARWAEGYPWREKLAKYKGELGKGVWGYWELGAWKPLGISARKRARLRKEVLLAGEDWTYDPPRGEMRTKRKGHKCDRISAEKRANTVELMKKMPQMLLDYKKRRWEKKMKEEDSGKS